MHSFIHSFIKLPYASFSILEILHLRQMVAAAHSDWSEAPIVNAIPDFPFLEGSRAIVGSRQLQARFGLIWALIGATCISCSQKHEPLARDKKVGQTLRALTLEGSLERELRSDVFNG